MKKTSHPVITGIITAVILLAAFVSCGNLNIRKQASIVISFGNARSVISYQKSDTAYYMISLQPEVQQPKRVEATQNAAEITGLEEGTYTLLVKAYNANDELIAEGRAENIQVAAGETAAATVQMAPKTYHVHDFATEWTTDAAYHWHAATCGDTDEIHDKAEHTFGDWITVTSATEENEGQKKRTCTVCNYEETETIPLLNHTHTWATGWTYDENNHWHECTSASCSETTEHIHHNWDNGTETTQPTCTAEGVMTYTCTVCHATRTEAIPATGHTFSEEWTHNDTEHWHECTSASCSETTEHIHHNWDNGTEETPATCTEEGELVYKCEDCGMERREVLLAQGHVWEYDYDEEEGTRGRTCKVCEYVDPERITANGLYTATYQFTETVQPAPADYSGSMERAGEKGRYVIFGDFPQSVAPKEFNINPHAEENGYYVGEDGCYYVRVQEDAYNSNSTYSDLSIAKQKSAKSYRYFKIEPIVWCVLKTDYDIDGNGGEETAALLFAENNLNTGIPFYENRENSNANNYRYSQLRAYLNGITYGAADTANNSKWFGKGFLQTVFTDDAQLLINETTITDSNNIKDKVFLLNKTEATTLISSNDARKRLHTDYVLANYSLNDFYWLRSPGSVFPGEHAVVDAGGITDAGYDADRSFYCIAPALTVPVSALPAQ